MHAVIGQISGPYSTVGNRSFHPNFKVVSFKVICDELTNYKRNKMSPL